MKRAVTLAAAALGIALSASASPASAPTPIVFSADRAPTVTGEIYRVDPNGRRVDLSNSPYDDGGAVVSSDGKRVAFVRYPGAFARVLEVGIDGRGLVAAAPRQVWYPQSLSWQPGGNLLAVEADPGVSIDQPGHTPIHIHTATFGFGGGDDFSRDPPSPWSPDGEVLLLWHGRNELRAVSPDGRTLWMHRAIYPSGGWTTGGWSPAGLVAIAVGRGVAVYDESGRLRFKYHLAWQPDDLVWSPDGSFLAASWSTASTKLQVRTASGAVVLQRHIPLNDSIAWANNSTVVVAAGHAIGVNIYTRTLSRASFRWTNTLSADRKLALVWRRNGVGAAPTDGGPLKIYRTLLPCNGDNDIESGQFAGRSIVYDSPCSPLEQLYSIGGRIHRLTNDRAWEWEPALSPDGTQIAYVRGARTEGIRIASAATGAAIRTLTNLDGWVTSDSSPSWSPDGQTIVYAEGTFRVGVGLFTIPAGGGSPTDLNLAGSNPAWGPARIAYEGPSREIWTANPDGSDPTKVTSHGHDPAWSPSGTLSYLRGTSSVMVGATLVHLPFAEVNSLAWSQDGTRFVVVASKIAFGLQDVYTVKVDGTDPIRLTKYYDASTASAG